MFVFQWAGLLSGPQKPKAQAIPPSLTFSYFFSLPKNLWLGLRITSLSVEIPRPFVCQKKRAFD